MNVVFLSPSYPLEMQDYVRGLAEIGANGSGTLQILKLMDPETFKIQAKIFGKFQNLKPMDLESSQIRIQEMGNFAKF